MITLSPEIECQIRRRMASGEYASVDQLLQQALTLLDALAAEVDDGLEELLQEGERTELLELTEMSFRQACREARRNDVPGI